MDFIDAYLACRLRVKMKAKREVKLDLIKLKLDLLQAELYPEDSPPTPVRRSSRSHLKQRPLLDLHDSPPKTTRAETSGKSTPCLTRFERPRLQMIGPGTYTPTMPQSVSESAFFGYSRRFPEKNDDWLLRKA